MISLINEIVSVENFVKTLFPDARTEKQQVPLDLTAGTFVIRVQSENRVSDTNYAVVVRRDYDIIYVSDTLPDVLAKMDDISQAVMDTTLIPINASARFIRVGAFSYSAPFQTDNDLYACIGVMQTEVREARPQDNSPLIGEVNTNIIVI